MKLSIIIPSCNRAVNLVHLLETISRLTANKQDFEILLVDNASTDNTKNLCVDFIDKNEDFDVRYLYEPVPGLLSGRHFGAANAKYDILCFLDDDVELSPNYVESILKVMSERPDIDLLTGPNLPKYDVYPPDWLDYFWKSTPYGGKQCGDLSLLDLGNKVIEIDAVYVWGLNFIIRKSAFEKLRGFHPDVIPQKIQFLQGDGETGLSIKANEVGMKALYHPNVLLHHLVPESRLTMNYFEKRYYYQGISDSYTQLRIQFGLYKKTDTEIKNISFSKKIKRYFKKIYIRLSKREIGKTENKERIDIMAKLQEKYTEGFAYHQLYFNLNPAIREWVLKPDYIDYKLPELC